MPKRLRTHTGHPHSAAEPDTPVIQEPAGTVTGTTLGKHLWPGSSSSIGGSPSAHRPLALENRNVGTPLTRTNTGAMACLPAAMQQAVVAEPSTPPASLIPQRAAPPPAPRRTYQLQPAPAVSAEVLARLHPVQSGKRNPGASSTADSGGLSVLQQAMVWLDQASPRRY
ncbi:hypothetical protein D9Q98_009045 [Chlorella vulgaris]|uniref:Uncharacterized protein n=1 Tax=Chlorella vulgaris TaxID=3077 RepID=A0A9D4TH50_CHLVU|nr:hypothetical protein D9Q98_009045 [Chlorella vulgaris]